MPSDIDELRRELDIVEVISDYINLERAGNSYKTNCPFHPDRTPSFYVSPSRQIFKCFGCGVGGDAIKFVSLYENVSYVQAAIQLAKRYGIKLRIKEDSSAKKKAYSVLEAVSEFYHSKLKEEREVLEYLRSRGIENQTVRKFKLGYSPSSNELIKFLRDMGELETYENTGNVSKIDKGVYRDLFRGRLIIPIRDHKGWVVGFGGRILRGEGPKYVNSPESEIFRKREVLFGLHEGIAYLRDLRSAILVEGYFDVITLHQEGFRNAVATLGTSFGGEHAKILSKFVGKVYLVFDGDEAGRRAIRLAVPHMLREGIDVYPVLLPEGTDPHDFILREGSRAFRELIEGSRDIFETLKERIKENNDVEGAVRDFTYFISFMKDEIRAYTLLSEFSKLTRIPVDVLARRMEIRKIEDSSEEKLSFTERIFLKGLFELKPEIDLDDYELTHRAREYAEYILREEYFYVPDDILNLKTRDLKAEFEASMHKLKIEIPEEERTEVSVREAVREMIRNHRGGIKPISLRKWRGRA